MTTIQLIHFIATHPEITNVVIKDMDDKHPIDAIAFLSTSEFMNEFPERWRINTGLEHGTLLVY